MPYKIIFLSSPAFAIPSLETLFTDKRFEIVAVLSQPDKKVGRKQILTPSDVKKKALELGLTVHAPKNINTPKNIQLIQNLKPDFLFSFAYGQIISDEILAIPKIEPINLHVSLLPKYRGASPIPSCLLNSEQNTGITFIRMIKKMDAGAMFYQKKFTIEKNDNAATLFEIIAELGKTKTPDVLTQIAEKKLTPIEQDENKASYCQKILRENGKINWKTETAEEIFNKIRAYTPWPGCYTTFKNKTLKIIEADFKSQTSPNPSFVRRGTKTPLLSKKRLGEVLQPKNNKIQITTKSGVLIPEIVQLEGKKAMSIEDFIKGKAGFIGSQLG